MNADYLANKHKGDVVTQQISLNFNIEAHHTVVNQTNRICQESKILIHKQDAYNYINVLSICVASSYYTEVKEEYSSSV